MNDSNIHKGKIDNRLIISIIKQSNSSIHILKSI